MSKKKSGLYLPDNGRKATTGKFSTNDFSVDGKSFYYRDPFNPEANEQVRADRRGDNDGDHAYNGAGDVDDGNDDDEELEGR